MSKRGSYNNKNNIAAQIEVFQRLLPFYGIRNICDYDTEIYSNSNVDFNAVNSMFDSIKECYKVSGLPNPVENTSQAITLLKGLCMQSAIPFHYEKTAKGYCFILARENTYLSKIRSELDITKVMPNYNSVQGEVRCATNLFSNSTFNPSSASRKLDSLEMDNLDLGLGIMDGTTRKPILHWNDVNLHYKTIKNCIYNVQDSRYYKYSNIITDVTDNGETRSWRDCFAELAVNNGDNVKFFMYYFPNKYRNLENDCLKNDWIVENNLESTFNYKFGNNYYRFIGYSSTHLVDIILSIQIIFDDKKNRRFGIVDTLYGEPIMSDGEPIECNIPKYCLPYNTYFIVIEITEEEARNNTPIACYIKQESGILHDKERKKIYNYNRPWSKNHNNTVEFISGVDLSITHIFFSKGLFKFSDPTKINRNGEKIVTELELGDYNYTTLAENKYVKITKCENFGISGM